jgi:hypothetical protein
MQKTCIAPTWPDPGAADCTPAHLQICCSQQQSTAQHDAAVTRPLFAWQQHKHTRTDYPQRTIPVQARKRAACVPAYPLTIHAAAMATRTVEWGATLQGQYKPPKLFSSTLSHKHHMQVPHVDCECNTQQSNLLPSSSQTQDATAQQMRISCKPCGSAKKQLPFKCVTHSRQLTPHGCFKSTSLPHTAAQPQLTPHLTVTSPTKVQYPISKSAGMLGSCCAGRPSPATLLHHNASTTHQQRTLVTSITNCSHDSTSHTCASVHHNRKPVLQRTAMHRQHQQRSQLHILTATTL